MKKKYLINIFCLIIMLFFSLGLFSYSYASELGSFQQYGDLDDKARLVSQKAGFADANQITVLSVTSIIIKTLLAFIGTLFLINMLAAGYNWMTSGGSEEKITKAKDTLKSSVIGLIIIVSAYAITYFIFQNLPAGVV